MSAHAAHLVVLTTLPDTDAAVAFVRKLVDARLAACGTVLPQAISVYRWQGIVEETSEVQVVLKTRGALWVRLLEAAREAHPYDVPELVALNVETGLPDYLRWMDDETTDPEDDAA